MSKKKPRYGLSPNFAKKGAKEFIDFDYLSSLSDDELDFLAKFSAEHYQNTFHNTENDFAERGSQQRKDCYSRENARNRDIWSAFYRLPLFEDTDSFDDSEPKK